MRGQSIGPHWVRSWDTDVPASRSQTELEQLLRRYGAKGYTLSSDYTNGTVVIAFYQLTLRGVQENSPFFPRVFESPLQLF